MTHPPPLRLVLLAVAVLLLLAPDAALATAGGGMPWDSGLGTLSTSVRQTVAFAMIVIALVGGVFVYILDAQLTGMFGTLARVGIGAAAIGGVVTLLSTFGMTAAVV